MAVPSKSPILRSGQASLLKISEKGSIVQNFLLPEYSGCPIKYVLLLIVIWMSVVTAK